MPIYEYRCTKCGHRFEAIQKVNDPPLSKCEKCKGKAERLISSPAIQFKGSGWYITDYARKGSPESTSKGSESSSSESSSETGSSKKKKKDKEKTGSSAK
ncbi:MAG TPA: FmdB family zinc ribbon protein [Vicinamibacteria bacterium]